MRVDEVMTRDVVSVNPSTSLKAAAEIFLSQRISGVPVVEKGRVVGVLSESDIVAKETSGFGDGEVSADEARHLRREREAEIVADAMTRNPVTAQAWFSIWAAADLMAVRDVNRLPVLDARGTLVGIVTRNDLVRAFARSDAAVERDVRDHLLPSVGLSPDALKIRVEHGVVTVSGEIESEVAKESLRTTVHPVPGAVHVEWNVGSPVGV